VSSAKFLLAAVLHTCYHLLHRHFNLLLFDMQSVKNKYAPVTKLQGWLKEATPALKQLLSKTAGTSEAMYRQWVAGRRGISADKAGALEVAMAEIKQRFPEAPDPLTRGDLCEACKKCPFYLDKTTI